MRHALILAGGQDTRLWPLSRRRLPMPLIPLIGGRSLLEFAYGRLDGAIPPERRWICAAAEHEQRVLRLLPQLGPRHFLGEPCDRDTLNGVAFTAAVLSRQDPDAVIAVCSADSVVSPVERFVSLVNQGLDWVEDHPRGLLIFGIHPAEPALSHAYVRLGASAGGSARLVTQIHHPSTPEEAQRCVDAGPGQFLWNSGMLVSRAGTLLECIHAYRWETYEGIERIQEAWGGFSQHRVLQDIYPTLEKVSMENGIVEPATRDPDVVVAALPMDLAWLDVGAWPVFAETCRRDEHGNALGAESALLMDSHNTVVASNQPDHLIATVGCQDLVIVHTADATLVCPRDRAWDVDGLRQWVDQRFGGRYV